MLLRGRFGTPQLRSWSSQPDGCEPLSLRRGEQTSWPRKYTFELAKEAAGRSCATRCGHLQALVQSLGGSGREIMGGVVLLADYLQKTEAKQTVVQWLPSHVGVIGNEIAMEEPNHNHGNHQFCQILGKSCDAASPSSGVRRSYLMVKDSPNSMKPLRRMIINRVCTGETQ
ncbi:hypothetical protein PoB_001064900 [Plakobranchus ocellatus]|uniref:RNase H type-1 domain-containing protein n=1 Tax=Plakobranchus ocellatus TaxID=259542 RepID=A0AAV3YQ28_9GAST|nr:hypothetical protein PoB_001064900 [Plakobranchus ocellatus]